MRADEASNIHDDGYMSDTYTHPGPLGINPAVTSADLGGICATITFDSHGHIITSCLNFQSGKLFLLNADTLAVLDSLDLPYHPISPLNPEFPAGSYFYLDNQDRVVLPVVGNKIWRLTVTNDNQFKIETVFDLNGVIPG